MNIEKIREYCIIKEATTEEMPFGDDILVFKVLGKMFAIMNLEGDLRLSLKCDPEKAVELRERFYAVKPGYHLSKIHWNTVDMDGSIDDQIICEWIDHSYALIVKGLPRKQREGLKNYNGG